MLKKKQTNKQRLISIQFKFHDVLCVLTFSVVQTVPYGVLHYYLKTILLLLKTLRLVQGIKQYTTLYKQNNKLRLKWALHP